MTPVRYKAIYDATSFELPHLLSHVYSKQKDFDHMCETVALHQYEQPNDEDIDQGPYQVWSTEHAGWNVLGSFSVPDDWLRERAYVLWDSDRAHKMGRLREARISH